MREVIGGMNLLKMLLRKKFMIKHFCLYGNIKQLVC